MLTINEVTNILKYIKQLATKSAPDPKDQLEAISDYCDNIIEDLGKKSDQPKGA